MSFNVLDDSWELKTIGDLVSAKEADVQTGPFGTMLQASSYAINGTPVIAVKDIGVNKILHGNSPLINDADTERLSKYKLLQGDIVFGRKGAVDRRALVTAKEEGWIQGSDCIRIRFTSPNIDSIFVSYFLGTKFYTNWILSNAQGTTMPSLNQEILKRVPIPIPSVEEQRRIASVLLVIDQKIELNNSINKNLEGMAQALFKRWFVDFEFPNENGETYKSSGGEFENSDLGLIPKGWKLGSIGDIASHRKDAIKPADIPSGTVYVGLEHVPRKKLALDSCGTSDALESNKTCFKKGDILFGKLRPYFHKVSIAPFNGVCSTDIIALNATEETYYGYLVSHLFSDSLVDYVTQCSNGTKMPRTNWNDISRFKIVIPDAKVSSDFTGIIKGIVNKMQSNFFENQQLSHIRDSLLPKLMSGEIRVPVERKYS